MCRRFLVAWRVVVVVLVGACLVACSLSRLVGVPATPVGTSTVQEGAPYPADMEHLDQILTVGRGPHGRKGQELPEGAQVVSVAPALNFAADFPGGWGYVIAFTATEEAIRDYVTRNTGFNGKYIDNSPAANPESNRFEDVDLSAIQNPWSAGFGDVVLLLERPLGRGWLIIRGAPR